MSAAAVTLPGTGQDVAVDLIAGWNYQFIKIGFGSIGAFTGVDASNPLPVVDATATSGTQRTKITDGTTNAAVKAASTASTGTDPAVVVALSPNNTIGLALDATITGGTQRTKLTDGTTNAAVKAASTAAIASDPALVVAVSPNNTVTVAGAVTANVGTTGGLALDATITGGTQQSRITDGTNVATVKAASTAAVAGDKAVVVAVSPNNTIPVSIAATVVTSGTVTANIGTSGSLALDATLTGGTTRTKITDGTSNAAVKAASTAAVAGDIALVVAVSPNNTVAVTQSGAPWSVGGNVANDAADSGNPVKVGGRAITAWGTAITAADRSDFITDLYNRQIITFRPAELQKSFAPAQFTTQQTSTMIWTPTSGKRIVVTSVIISTTGTTAGKITLYFGTGAYTPGTTQPVAVINFVPSATSNPGAIVALSDHVAALNVTTDLLKVTSSAAVTFDLTIHGYEI
jgi:hypothetical protein